VLEADYSAALTLLLRYPVPLPPHGPATFVGDALYLRENLLLDGGDHIISKYSRRAPETTVTRKLPKKVRRARTAEQEAAKNALLPRTAPARIFQDQGGIEGIIHEAAKGVYSRGEKWGVGKALRGAMQGLQSGHSSPRRVSERARWSLDSGKMVQDQPAETTAKIQSLEKRNQSLAKLLENAVDELWVQQKQIHEKDNEGAADALGLCIAKVQFVQVYLENSSMPLPTDIAPPSEAASDGTVSASVKESRASSRQQKLPLKSAQVDGSSDEQDGKINDASKGPPAPTQEIQRVQRHSPPITPIVGSPTKASSPPARPSLDKSPFSWMLGEEQRKSEFVAASPFRPEKSRGESGNLFGDSARHNSSKHRRNLSTNGKGEGNEDDDVF